MTDERLEERLVERLVALRGATTVDADTSEVVMVRTRELLSALLERNDVDHDQLVSIIFPSTKDLRSAFPAARRAIVRTLTQAANGTPQSQSNKKIL